MHFVYILIILTVESWANSTSVKSQSWQQDLWTTKRAKRTRIQPKPTIVPESDLRDLNRRIWIITTASLPWLTGTSVNPLLRAAYLAKDRPKGKVTLMVPWLKREEQNLAFPPSIRFDNPNEQKSFVKKWLIEEARMPISAEKLEISFYSASYHDEYHSIFPMGDITDLIPDDQADVCVLEEPEHLNWYRAPFVAKAWMDKFKHVVGIIHTNYLVYTRAHNGGAFKEPLLYYVNQGMCRAYCHKIIKLSGALQEFAPEKEVISNVHGVREKFLDIGDRFTASDFTRGAYFVGKLAWAKGLGELFNLMSYVKKRTGRCFPIDIFGQGPHETEIKNLAIQAEIPATFHGGKDHALLREYKVFVNPSLSEVLCTTNVEALAMNKWLICAKHPSNEFFEQFPNCLTFSTEEEFSANVFWALHHDPPLLTREQKYALTWEAATERLMTAATITPEMQARSTSFTDNFSKWVHTLIGAGKHGDLVRLLAGGRSASNQIEYMKQYGSAHPVVELQSYSDGSHDQNYTRSDQLVPGQVSKEDIVVASSSTPEQWVVDDHGGSSEDIQGDTSYEDHLPCIPKSVVDSTASSEVIRKQNNYGDHGNSEP